MVRTILIIFSILSFWLSVSAQEEIQASQLKSGMESGGSICYTGLNVNLAYALVWKDNTFFAGPKITISDTYLPSKGPWGIHAGYRRLLPGQSKMRTFAAFEYQVVFLKPFNPNNIKVKGMNKIHELHFSYGIQYKVWKNLIIGNSIGAGIYVEQFFDIITGNKKSYDGFNGQFRLFAQYSF